MYHAEPQNHNPLGAFCEFIDRDRQGTTRKADSMRCEPLDISIT
jgi:hypothetical protein